MNNLKYVIIDSSYVSSVDFSRVKETSADTLRYSRDGTKTFVKYEGDAPDFLSSLDNFTEYNHSQILSILNDAAGDWYDPDTP